jgi:hypothetical protein
MMRIVSPDEFLVEESHRLLARQANQRRIEVLQDLPPLVVDRAVALVVTILVRRNSGTSALLRDENHGVLAKVTPIPVCRPTGN